MTTAIVLAAGLSTRLGRPKQLLMLEGAVCVHIDAKSVRLRDGDCLDFDVMRAVTFENETKQDARYVIITRRGTSYGKM